MDLELNNLQSMICRKTKPNQCILLYKSLSRKDQKVKSKNNPVLYSLKNVFDKISKLASKTYCDRNLNEIKENQQP